MADDAAVERIDIAVRDILADVDAMCEKPREVDDYAAALTAIAAQYPKSVMLAAILQLRGELAEIKEATASR